jgi:hypothetical protein
MKEIIELLNHTSGARTLFYCVVFLIALGIIADAVVGIVKALFKKRGGSNGA